MINTLGLTVAVLFMLRGLYEIIWPDALPRSNDDEYGDETPQRRRRRVRLEGFIMFLFGACLLYAILHDDGGPVDAVGF